MTSPVSAVVTFDYVSGSPVVSVARTDDVPEPFWLKVLAEWGTRGRSPASKIEVLLSTFLGRLDWLAPFCRRYRVRTIWEGSSRALVETRRGERAALSAALGTSEALSPIEVTRALEGGRFSRDLRDFQLRDVGKLLSLPHGANFSVPGAGKTAVAYAVYEASRLRGQVGQLLVVSPISAFESWRDEAEASFSVVPRIARFPGDDVADAEILLVNYQRLESGFDFLSSWVAARPTHVVLDEAHRMKRGWSGEWGRNCLNLAQLAARRDILTGTPAPQSVSDLDALFDFLWPGQSHRLIPEADRQETLTLDRVATVIDPLFVRTTKTELELPEPLIELVAQPLEGLHADIYAALRGRYGTASLMSRSARVDFRHMGRVVMYLLEAATNPSLLTAGSHRYDPIQFRHPPLDIPLDSELEELLEHYADYETPWKFEFVAQLVEANASQGRKTIVWSNFVRNLETLNHTVLDHHQPAMVHGGVTTQRDTELHRFRTDPACHVLVANPATTGEGISLHQSCHDAVYLERTFNARQYLQSVDRIHRLGLAPDQETRVTILSSSETIDSVVDSRLREKTENLGRLLRDPALAVMSLPSEFEEGLDDESETGTDNADMRELMLHLDG